MSVVNSGRCWNCQETGHWADACPLLTRAKNVVEHRKRIDRITQRFLDGEIGPRDKTRLIQQENEQWNSTKTGAK